jgi:hypothetical protein
MLRTRRDRAGFVAFFLIVFNFPTAVSAAQHTHVAGSPQAPAQPPTAALTLDDLEQLALQSNPTLAQAAAVVEASRTYIQFSVEYLEALHHLRRAEVEIRGLLLTDGLNEPPRPTPLGHLEAVPRPRYEEASRSCLAGASGSQEFDPASKPVAAVVGQVRAAHAAQRSKRPGVAVRLLRSKTRSVRGSDKNAS